MGKMNKMRNELYSGLTSVSFPTSTLDEQPGLFPCDGNGLGCLIERILAVKKEVKHKTKPEPVSVATPEQQAQMLLKILGL